MKPTRLLLCTDMDRTIIPNGSQPEHPQAREQFRTFCNRPEVALAYVTGRHQALVKQAIREYDLPEPDYVIADVGTKIYRLSSGCWQELELWKNIIAEDWHGVDGQQIMRSLSSLPALRAQEQSKQSRFKLSYYLPLATPREPLFQAINDRLQQLEVKASLVWSVDEPKQIGLLDILPRQANKLTAIVFLQQQLAYKRQEVIFAGDSGNDLPVLGSPVQAVLVANASAEIKRQARQLSEQNGQNETLYFATDDNFFLGGNYAAGVLQGVCHFIPGFQLAMGVPKDKT